VIARVVLLALAPLAASADLERGVEAYRAARYAEARECFERALSEPRSPRGELHHALGNCAFRSGEYPTAILCYRRAEVWLEDDRAARANRALAERRSGLAPREWERVAALASALSAGEWLALLVALEGAGLVVLALARRRAARVTGALLAWLALAGGAGIAWVQAQERAPRGVALESLALRRDPHADLPPVAELPAGTTVAIEAASGRWALVRQGSTTGWVPSSRLGWVLAGPRAERADRAP